MPLIESDHVIQALAAQGPNEPLHVAILPRGARGNRNLYQTDSCNPPPELGSVDRIAMANQVPTARLLGKRLDHLLGGPCRRRPRHLLCLPHRRGPFTVPACETRRSSNVRLPFLPEAITSEGSGDGCTISSDASWKGCESPAVHSGSSHIRWGQLDRLHS